MKKLEGLAGCVFLNVPPKKEIPGDWGKEKQKRTLIKHLAYVTMRRRGRGLQRAKWR